MDSFDQWVRSYGSALGAAVTAFIAAVAMVVRIGINSQRLKTVEERLDGHDKALGTLADIRADVAEIRGILTQRNLDVLLKGPHH